MTKKMASTIVLCGLVLFALAGIGAARIYSNLSRPPLHVGESLPFIDVSNIRAPAAQPPTDKKLYVFVRSTCSHCERLLQILPGVLPNVSPQPAVEVISVGSKEDARELAARHTSEFLNFYADPSEIAFEECRGTVVPLQILVDRKNKIIGVHKGEMDPKPEEAFLETGDK